jgi:cyclopropane fatty-acyl-phospholipid synthase-like methyltransferase
MSTAAKRGLNNVNVITGDITTFDLPSEYKEKADRVISIEMFEHMKNYQLLLNKISTWLKPQGKVGGFV